MDLRASIVKYFWITLSVAIAIFTVIVSVRTSDDMPMSRLRLPSFRQILRAIAPLSRICNTRPSFWRSLPVRASCFSAVARMSTSSNASSPITH